MVQSVYKVWSAFTKTLRAVIVKQIDEDMAIKTVYFGRFYAPKFDPVLNQRPIVYQPPTKLQNACNKVIQDSSTLPAGERYHFQNSDSLFSKDIKLNFYNIAKASHQSLNTVESSLQGLFQHLLTVIAASNDGNLKIKLNFRIGTL